MGEHGLCALHRPLPWPGRRCQLDAATPREDAEALRWSLWTVTEAEKTRSPCWRTGRRCRPISANPDLAETAERRLQVPLRVLEQHLAAQQARGEAHLAANRFTVADLCVASVLNWARPAHALFEAHPRVSAAGGLHGPSRLPGTAQQGLKAH